MGRVDPIPEPQALSKLLGECGTGSDIDRVLYDRGIEDNTGQSTKCRRL